MTRRDKEEMRLHRALARAVEKMRVAHKVYNAACRKASRAGMRHDDTMTAVTKCQIALRIHQIGLTTPAERGEEKHP